MKDYDKEIEELEKGCGKIVNYFAELICEGKNIQYCHTCTRKAKELKEEIEKGCGKSFDWNYLGDKYNFICEAHGSLSDYCPKCQNNIEKLNKIIGVEE